MDITVKEFKKWLGKFDDDAIVIVMCHLGYGKYGYKKFTFVEQTYAWDYCDFSNDYVDDDVIPNKKVLFLGND